MRIAVEGCAHGELEIIYNTIQEIEKVDGRKIDLLICCGDFQATRNLSDLECMAISDKYKDMCTFYKYYSGEKEAPVLTVFIGGNHEASNHLQELPYGGWVAPNIFYLGYAGVIQVAGVRIAGLSGIYKSQHWMQGHHEKPPYTDQTLRSVYHVRNLEIFRLKQLSGKIDIFLSHDWPAGVTKYGDEDALLKRKPFFRSDIESNTLGSPPCMELLEQLYPSYWFSAHLHCKFAAIIPKKGEEARVTKFLALDKCLPKRKFLQVLEVRSQQESPLRLSYDLEWLTILYLTNHLLSVKTSMHSMPGRYGSGRWMYTPTAKERQTVYEKFDCDLQVPLNFTRTAQPYDPSADAPIEPPRLTINDQTTRFCQTLGIDDPSTLLQIIANSKEIRSGEMSINMSSVQPMEISTFDEEGELLSSFEEHSSSKCLSGETSPVNSPKSNNGDDEYDDSADVNTSENVPDDSANDSTTFVDSAFTDDGNVQCVQTEPNCKKFKRRNYSLYSNTLVIFYEGIISTQLLTVLKAKMDKLTIISGILFLAADIFAIASLAMPDWIITDIGGDTRLGLMISCMTLHNRPQVCYKSDLQSEWLMALVFIFVGCILITATIILLVSSHWDRNVIPYARWVGFGAMVLFCYAAVIFPMGFHIDEIGGQPYQLPNSHQVGISYILFVLALWITVISELFAGKVCLPHF
ncbi:PREDICTED: lariat debranching enzyme-like [Dinoponera quadriceps]|uniref:Lariat debranching enzyme-like n=1 Tax=Dinoponera quadriceps TaxID=609295 RepID=A0A6P3XPI6_DINQU|nr:PREDICTED: lariat debranching enzyme-like [Dinoponera quadriceps]